MDYLIESDKDVNLLRQKGIIFTNIGEDKEVARIFKEIGKGVAVSQGFYDNENYKKAIQRCERPWNKMKASLKHNYFSSPWPNQRGIRVEERGMAHSIEITPIDDEIPLLPQTKKDEIEEQEGMKVDHLIEFKETNGQDLFGSETKKSINQIFDEKFKNLDNSFIKSCTIFRVNVRLRESNPDAYAPNMVAIGPYHRKNIQLRPMEKYKLLYLRRFLCRKEGLDVKSCISELEKEKEKAIKCYDDIEELDHDSSTGHQMFLEMLLLDGCFVIEFIWETFGEFPKGEDKIIKVDCISEQVLRDLVLLENQLPFFVLIKLHNMTNHANKINEFIHKLGTILRAKLSEMNPAFFAELRNSNYAEAKNIKHLLHVLHMSHHWNSIMDDAGFDRACNFTSIRWLKRERDHDKILPNAIELSEAGVSFAKLGSINYFGTRLFEDYGDCREESTSLLFDIKFNKGVMNIPCFQVVKDTETLLRNLIAYEQQSSDVEPKYFSDYAIFMDLLIDSEKDVNLLRRKGIIVSCMEDDRELASFFNRIGKGVIFYPDEFCYKKECKKAFRHCEKPWNKMKANLRHNYFSSVWVGASTVAAIVLLLLTAMQTVLAFTGGVK
ncbi:hypothetical protein RDI58_030577 [Solanum bulbocastanum]|uniref:Uncharacterized protein n=1 Tax=Solanum bulbocastanum TaxID=147425 RepID=A0AAN8SNU5_SOLBU